MQPPMLSGETYRLILDLDPFLIREAFQYGNDDSMIRHFADRVGMHVYRELKTMNMHRFRDSPFGVRRMEY